MGEKHTEREREKERETHRERQKDRKCEYYLNKLLVRTHGFVFLIKNNLNFYTK